MLRICLWKIRYVLVDIKDSANCIYLLEDLCIDCTVKLKIKDEVVPLFLVPQFDVRTILTLATDSIHLEILCPYKYTFLE